jgi:hypothetical protein
VTSNRGLWREQSLEAYAPDVRAGPFAADCAGEDARGLEVEVVVPVQPRTGITLSLR